MLFDTAADGKIEGDKMGYFQFFVGKFFVGRFCGGNISQIGRRGLRGNIISKSKLVRGNWKMGQAV